jgi:hypothetical protein
MAEATYAKLDIAVAQLETALDLYHRSGDMFSVITLAGAAEEILGQILVERGVKHSLEWLKQGAVAIHLAIYGEEIGAKVFATRANRARNALKHHTPGDPGTVTLDLDQEAVDLLDRAITNYWALEKELSHAIIHRCPARYRRWRRLRIVYWRVCQQDRAASSESNGV